MKEVKEKCGVFGIHDSEDASALTALGLHALQHRGQEGCGVVSFDGKSFHSEKRQGLVGDNFTNKDVLKKLPGKFAIGHNRYSTTGETFLQFGYGSEDNLTGDLIADPADVVLKVNGRDYVSDETFDPTNLIQTDKFGVVPVDTTLTVEYTANTTNTVNVSVGSLTRCPSPRFQFLDQASLDSGLVETVIGSLEVDNDDPILGDTSIMLADEIRERADQLKELASKSEVNTDTYADSKKKMLGKSEDLDAQPQDKDVKKVKGTQPKKYYKKLDKDTKKKRADFFKKKSGSYKKSDDNDDYKAAPGDKKAKTKPSIHTKKFKQMYGEGLLDLEEKIKGIENKAKKTGMPYGILKKVYDRGMAAWKGGHRPGATQQQWAFARVNSFVTKSSGTWGGADKDLAKKVRGSK